MNTNPQTQLDTENSILIDASEARAPGNIIMLKSAIKTAGKDPALFALMTSDPLAEVNLRSFCQNAGHHYFHQNGQDIHYIRMAANTQCTTCSNVRIIAAAALTVGTLAVTAPYMIKGNSSFGVTIAFVLSLCFLPPALYNIVTLSIKAYRKLTASKDAINNAI